MTHDGTGTGTLTYQWDAENRMTHTEISRLTAAAFKDIVAASRDHTVYCTPFMPAGALAGMLSGGRTN